MCSPLGMKLNPEKRFSYISVGIEPNTPRKLMAVAP